MKTPIISVICCLFLFTGFQANASDTAKALAPAYTALIQAYDQEIKRLLEMSSSTPEDLEKRSKNVKKLVYERTTIIKTGGIYMPKEKKEK